MQAKERSKVGPTAQRERGRQEKRAGTGGEAEEGGGERRTRKKGGSGRGKQRGRTENQEPQKHRAGTRGKKEKELVPVSLIRAGHKIGFLISWHALKCEQHSSHGYHGREGGREEREAAERKGKGGKKQRTRARGSRGDTEERRTNNRKHRQGQHNQKPMISALLRVKPLDKYSINQA